MNSLASERKLVLSVTGKERVAVKSLNHYPANNSVELPLGFAVQLQRSVASVASNNDSDGQKDDSLPDHGK